MNHSKLIGNAVKGNKRFDIRRKLPYRVFEKYSDGIKDLSKRIYNDIENNKYTYDDLILYLLHDAMVNGRKSAKFICNKNINKVKALYSPKQFERDKINILALNKKIKLKKFYEYFSLDYEGKSIIFRLVKKQLISPLFWIEYDRMWFKVKQEFEEDFEHFLFRKCCELIKEQVLIERKTK